MSIALSEIIVAIVKNRKTGLLSTAVTDSNNLFKMFFRDGTIYHISCGNLKGTECLKDIARIDFSECSFIPDIKLDLALEVVLPTPEVIAHLQAAAKTVESLSYVGSGQPLGVLDTEGFSVLRDKLTIALVRQLGPVGGKIVAKTVDQKWHASSPPTKKELYELIDILKNEIDNVDDRNDFTKEAYAIIS